MNHAIRRVGLILGLLVLALMININVQQVFLANETRDRPGNQRTVLEEYDRERGPILVGSDPVARSIPTDDQYKVPTALLGWTAVRVKRPVSTRRCTARPESSGPKMTCCRVPAICSSSIGCSSF